MKKILLVVVGILFSVIMGVLFWGRLYKAPEQIATTVTAKSVQSASNRITVPKGYTRALFETIADITSDDHLSQEDIQRLNKVEKIAQKGLDLSSNQFQSQEKDQQILIEDINHLPRDVQIELSLLTAELLQGVRQQIGSEVELYVNDLSLDFAHLIAEEYRKDNWQMRGGHDVPAINRAAGRLGFEEYPQNAYENLASTQTNGVVNMKQRFQGDKLLEEVYYYHQPLTVSMTLDDLKERIYNNLLDFLFDDGLNPRTTNPNVQGHAKSLLGLNRPPEVMKEYLAISYSFYEEPYLAEQDYIYSDGRTAPSLNTMSLHIIIFVEEQMLESNSRREELSSYYKRE